MPSSITPLPTRRFAVPVILFLAGVMFQRPMILGYASTTLGLVLCAGAVLSSLLLLFKDGRVDRRFFLLFMLAIIVGTIMIIVSVPATGLKIAVTSMVIMVTIQLACFVTIATFPLQTLTYTRILLRIIVYSSLITLVLVGFDVNKLGSLAYATLPVRGHAIIDEFSLLFPASTIPYRMTNELFILPRATFLSIEPGTGVLIVFFWRFLEDAHSKKYAFLHNVVFVLALISTASTTAPIILGAYFAVPRFFEGVPIAQFKRGGLKINVKKLVISTTLLFIAVYLLFYAPYFGIIDKSATHGSSFEDRINTYAGTKGSAIHRYISFLFLILVYYLARRFIIKRGFAGPYLALVTVSLLNVMAFSAIYWVMIYLILVIKMRDEQQAQSEPPHSLQATHPATI